jgi:hypothetical protein
VEPVDAQMIEKGQLISGVCAQGSDGSRMVAGVTGSPYRFEVLAGSLSKCRCRALRLAGTSRAGNVEILTRSPGYDAGSVVGLVTPNARTTSTAA